MPGRFRWGPWAAVSLVLPLAAEVALADWPANGAPVSVFPCDEVPTSAIADGAGGMFLFWNDNRTCGRSDAYLQRITGSGAIAPGWPDQGLPVCALFGGQSYPTGVSDGSFGVIVVWVDRRSGASRLFAERIGPGGSRLWNPEGVPVCDAAGGQGGFGVLSDGAGGAFVSWMDTRRGLDDGPPHHHPLFDLYAQRLDAQGSRLWPATGLPVATNALVQAPGKLVSDGGSGVLVMWPAGPTYMQHLDAAGVAQLAPNGVAIAGRFYGDVVTDGAGGMISTFMSGPDTQEDLFAQRVDAQGNILWPMDGVLVASAAYGQRPNSIIPDGNGGAFIASYDLRNGLDWDVYVQRITASGAASPGWPANGLAVCTEPGFQIYPMLAPDFAGGCVVTWPDARDTTAAYDIYAQRITGQGTIAAGWPATGAVICHASGDQTSPFPVPDGTGGALVAWNDGRVYQDIYAERVNGSGVVGASSPLTGVGPPALGAFSLGRIFPNPLAGRALSASVSLPDAAPAQLSLFDLRGRRLARRLVEAGPSGTEVVELRLPGGLRSGVYMLQLEQRGRVMSRKVSIVH